jgi:HK97 family phage portal protein
MTVAAITPGLGRPSLVRAPGGVLLPSPTDATVGPYVYDAISAQQVPAVSRAVGLYAGLVRQCAMECWRGYQRLPTPRLLERPDPWRGGPWFVGVNVEDYLLSGNAISLITSRGADGWPLSVQWLPVNMVYILWDWYTGELTYTYLGQPLPLEDVVHVRRGADRLYPVRGVGVVEEHLSTLDRVAMENEYERGALGTGGVPSVAVITPQANLTQENADQAKADWAAKFSGPVREPVILPNGTVVQPLAWSPGDTQLAEMRRLSLIDVANMFNLDGYWLGAPVAGMTYRTAGPQYQQILRTSLEPVLADFESVWSDAWLVRGQTIRFKRDQLLREDLPTSTTAAVAAYGAGLVSLEEARVMIGLPPDVTGAIGAGADQGAPASQTPDAEPPGQPDNQTADELLGNA